VVEITRARLREENGSGAGGELDDLLVCGARVHHLRNTLDLDLHFPQPRDDEDGDVDIGQDLHAAEGSESVRPEASQAA
jgi:hypothetical protein